MEFEIVSLTDKLPLTCTLEGTCCFGNKVNLNPWEIYYLAKGLQIPVSNFISKYCDDFGLRLKFNGIKNKKGYLSCNLYQENKGCSVHEYRPLACRLFPLGRKIQSEQSEYFYEKPKFPCFIRCPKVIELPTLSVQDYLSQQKTFEFENVQDAYLEILQNIADISFSIYFDTGLHKNDNRKITTSWKKNARKSSAELFKLIGIEWQEIITNPIAEFSISDFNLFIQKHAEIIELKIEKEISEVKTENDYIELTIKYMNIAYLIAKSIGANSSELGDLWVKTAHENS
jgi:Fe-S-cluster containining protein